MHQLARGARRPSLQAIVAILVILTAPALGAAQAPMGVVYDGASPVAHAFGGRSWILLHVAVDSSVLETGVIVRGRPLGSLVPHPRLPEGRAAAWLDSTRSAYDAGSFDLAVAAADSGLAADPDNPHLLDARARALFRQPHGRGESLDTYRRLMHVLDGQSTEPDLVVVDPHFAESYGKLGSLHLDGERYDEAAYALTRAELAGRALGAPVEFRVAQLAHLVEAYVELGEADVARFFATETLRLDPRNQYVLPYLERIGPGPDSPLACREAGNGQPRIGVYALFANRADGAEPAEREQLLCASATEDGDDSIRPCLRIGRVHVGQRRAEVEQRLGAPFLEVPGPAGAPAYAYLVFANQATATGAYYVLTYEEAGGETIVESVQLTGQEPPLPHSFACLGLGSPAAQVRRQLGLPALVTPFAEPDHGLAGDRWVYDDAPVSLELVDGHVASIRVSRPPDVPARPLRLLLLDVAERSARTADPSGA
jgi:tetratricopeptide (TPR) repeat protein